MKKLLILIVAMLAATVADAKTLVVYYSFTNNVHTIVSELQAQTGADAVRIEPAQEGIDYAADNYAIGSALISAIRNNPDDAASYPAIKPVNVNLYGYDMIIVAAPLWWNNMAALLQTWLFHHGTELAGKKIGLIVSSASSGISGVEADARRLIPGGDFISPSLWIRSAQTQNCRSLISAWLEQIDYNRLAADITLATPADEVDINITTQGIAVAGQFDLFTLYDLSGAKVMELSQMTSAPRPMNPGIYLARIDAGDRVVSRKIKVGR